MHLGGLLSFTKIFACLLAIKSARLPCGCAVMLPPLVLLWQSSTQSYHPFFMGPDYVGPAVDHFQEISAQYPEVRTWHFHFSERGTCIDFHEPWARMTERCTAHLSVYPRHKVLSVSSSLPHPIAQHLPSKCGRICKNEQQHSSTLPSSSP